MAQPGTSLRTSPPFVGAVYRKKPPAPEQSTTTDLIKKFKHVIEECCGCASDEKYRSQLDELVRQYRIYSNELLSECIEQLYSEYSKLVQNIDGTDEIQRKIRIHEYLVISMFNTRNYPLEKLCNVARILCERLNSDQISLQGLPLFKVIELYECAKLEFRYFLLTDEHLNHMLNPDLKGGFEAYLKEAGHKKIMGQEKYESIYSFLKEKDLNLAEVFLRTHMPCFSFKFLRYIYFNYRHECSKETLSLLEYVIIYKLSKISLDLAVNKWSADILDQAFQGEDDNKPIQLFAYINSFGLPAILMLEHLDYLCDSAISTSSGHPFKVYTLDHRQGWSPISNRSCENSSLPIYLQKKIKTCSTIAEKLSPLIATFLTSDELCGTLKITELAILRGKQLDFNTAIFQSLTNYNLITVSDDTVRDLFDTPYFIEIYTELRELFESHVGEKITSELLESFSLEQSATLYDEHFHSRLFLNRNKEDTDDTPKRKEKLKLFFENLFALLDSQITKKAYDSIGRSYWENPVYYVLAVSFLFMSGQVFANKENFVKFFCFFSSYLLDLFISTLPRLSSSTESEIKFINSCKKLAIQAFVTNSPTKVAKSLCELLEDKSMSRAYVELRAEVIKKQIESIESTIMSANLAIVQYNGKVSSSLAVLPPHARERENLLRSKEIAFRLQEFSLRAEQAAIASALNSADVEYNPFQVIKLLIPSSRSPRSQQMIPA